MLAGNEGAKRKYLWWGRYLTMFQMFQVWRRHLFPICPRTSRSVQAAVEGHRKAARLSDVCWAQFVTMMGQAAYTSRHSPYPAFLSRLLFYYMQTLLALFAHFFIRKYALGGRQRKARAGSSTGLAMNGKHGHGVNGVNGIKRE